VLCLIAYCLCSGGSFGPPLQLFILLIYVFFVL